MSEKPVTRKRKSTASSKRKSRRRVKKQEPMDAANPLPAPVDVSEEKGKENSSLLDSLGSMFQSQSPTSQNQSQSENLSGTDSSISGKTLTSEDHAQLNAVPDVIGDEPTSESASAEMDSGAAMVSLLDNVAFSEQDVTDTLTELFSWAADKFESDHWKLTERQQRMLGGPTTQIVNVMWIKLREKLPDILARWCESTPGATAFLMAFGIVVVPKAMKQVKLSRAKRNVITAETSQAVDAPAPKRPQPIWPTSIGIPEASGIIGG